MKLQDLAIGARFEYDGKIFTKTGPLTACAEQGGQRMIPRYADLRPIAPGAPGENPKSSGKLDETCVKNAFETFYQTCVKLLGEAELPELEVARKTFLARLR